MRLLLPAQNGAPGGEECSSGDNSGEGQGDMAGAPRTGARVDGPQSIL